MSSIITPILSSTLGLLWNKARDTMADKLKNGDVTDSEIRKIVVRELNDIKTKLDGLLRKDLHSSCGSLQEGIGLLNLCLDKTKLEEKASLNEAQDERGCGEASRTSSVSVGESSTFDKALELSDAMRKVKIDSDKEFETAKERFKEARTTATHAFYTEALSIKDRILAAKVRIISEILENLESPDTAIAGCLVFLERLHSLPAVQEMFSVYLNRSVIKSRFNKAERVENVKAVMFINNFLYQFVSKFSRQYSFVLYPTIIQLAAGRCFNPILNWQEVSTIKSWGEELIQPPNQLVLQGEIQPYRSAVNSRNEIVLWYGNNINVIARTGESKLVKVPDPLEGEFVEDVQALAVDKNNNVFLVAVACTKENALKSYVLYVFDQDMYSVKRTQRLYFLTMCEMSMIAVDANNQIIMITSNKIDLFIDVCKDTGELIYKFRRDSPMVWSLSTLETDEILVPSDDQKAVHRYTAEGESKPAINIPNGHKVLRVAFHPIVGQIVVLSLFETQNLFYLLCYSKAGALKKRLFFGKRDEEEKDERTFPHLISNPRGPVAVVRMNSITFV